MKRFVKKHWAYLLAAILIIFLFSLRLLNLTLLPVFADEAIYIRWAQVMKAEETLRFLPQSDGKEPLFMWAIIPLLKFIENPLFAGRLLSVLCGFGTLLGIATLSWLLFRNYKVSLVSMLIYAVSPFAFFFDRMSLVDSMLSMFGIWVFIFSYLAFTKRRLDFAMLAGFALGGAWLTKSPALFFALMAPVLWLFISWDKPIKQKFYAFLNSAGLYIVTVALGYGFYNILRLGPNFYMIARRNLDYVYPFSHIFTSPLDPLKPFLLQSFEWLIILGGGLLLIFAAFSLIRNAPKWPKEIFVLVLWFAFPVIVESEFAKVLTARYIFFTLPYLIILAGASFHEVKGIWIKALTFILAFYVSQSLVTDYKLLTYPENVNLPRSERSGYLEDWTAGQGISETATYLINEQMANGDEKIVIGTEGYFGTLPDGLQIYLQNYPQITVIGVGLNFSELPASLAESKKAGNKTYLLINDERFKGDPGKSGLTLIREYPKATRPDGTRQSLLFFEVNGKGISL